MEITNGKVSPMAEHVGQAKASSAATSAATSAAEAAGSGDPAPSQRPAERLDPEGRPADAEATEALRLDEEYALLFALGVEEAYHCDRAAFLKWVDRVGSFVTALMGTAAVGGAVGQAPVIGVLAGTLVAVIETGKLVIDFAGEVRKHEVKVERLKGLRAALATSRKSLLEIRAIEAQRVALEQVEAAEYFAVSSLAWNKTYLSLSRSPDRINLFVVKPWDVRLRHVRRFTADRFSTRKELQEDGSEVV